MTLLEFSLVFSLGLVSSLHCLQMCGPIVLAYSLPLAGCGRTQLARAHLAYNAGRILTYMLLGALAGAAGGALGLAGRLAGFANAARIIAGAGMILAGLLIAGVFPAERLVRIGPVRQPLSGSKFRLGLALGFLPCGLVYAALLKSMETGTAMAGALTMLAFGLGTSGALLSIGLASSALAPRLGIWSNRLAAVSISLLGLYLIWRGIAPHAGGHG